MFSVYNLQYWSAKVRNGAVKKYVALEIKGIQEPMSRKRAAQHWLFLYRFYTEIRKLRIDSALIAV